MGLPRELAQRLTAQTLLGAAKMVLKTGMHQLY
jgi:pyrroline-5-carboxylate reductase